jgi:hypothetical protein
VALGAGFVFAATTLAIEAYAILTTEDPAVTPDVLRERRLKTAMEYDLNGIDPNDAKTIPVPLGAILADPAIRGAIAIANGFVSVATED